MTGPDLGSRGRSFGLWSGGFRNDDRHWVAEAAAELDELGWAALWYPGGVRRTFETADVLLSSTRNLTVATGIANIWVNPPSEAAAASVRLALEHDGRFLLGLGASHGPMVERAGLGEYKHPLARMSSYLDELDAHDPPVPTRDRILGALGPRMLDLAAERTLGTHPYLVTPDHTARIREQLGPEARVMPEQGVVLNQNPEEARATAREALAMYLGLPNYVNNWLRLGFTEADITGGGSDRLVDALVIWGSPESVADRLGLHHEAGADHVAVQVLGAASDTLPLPEWRILAAALQLS